MLCSINSVCLCVFSMPNTRAHAHTHTHTHLFPDLNSTLLTPGVPVESSWAALPLTEISTCCLGTASARLISDRNQSSRHKPSSTYYVFEGAPTACRKNAHTHTHTLTYTNRKSLKTTRRLRLDVSFFFFFDGKQSAKTERNHLTERENVTVCIRRPCTFDTREWGGVEVHFEGEGRTIIKACFWKTQRNLGTRCSLWLKTNWFLLSTSHDLTYQEA